MLEMTESYHNHQGMLGDVGGCWGEIKNQALSVVLGLHACTKSKVSSTSPTKKIQLISNINQMDDSSAFLCVVVFLKPTQKVQLTIKVIPVSKYISVK